MSLNDTEYIILEQVADATTFKSCRLVCYDWYLYYKQNYIEWIQKFTTLEIYVFMSRDLKWDYSRLTNSNNITIEVIRAKSQCSWDWQRLHLRKDFTYNLILENPDKYWDWGRLSSKAPLEIILELYEKSWKWETIIDRFGQEFYEISENHPIWFEITKLVDPKFIRKHSHYNWNWKQMPYIYCDLEFIIENINQDWDWFDIHLKLDKQTLKYLIQIYPSLNWNWGYIIHKLKITVNIDTIPNDNIYWNINCDKYDWDYIYHNLQKKWNWYRMHMHNKFNCSWIIQIPDQNWDWFSIRPTLEVLMLFPDKHWNTRYMNNLIMGGEFY